MRPSIEPAPRRGSSRRAAYRNANTGVTRRARSDDGWSSNQHQGDLAHNDEYVDKDRRGRSRKGSRSTDSYSDHRDDQHHDDGYQRDSASSYGSRNHSRRAYNNDYNYTYNHNYRPSNRTHRRKSSFSFGLHLYPYYSLFSHRGSYNRYSYGYGYSPYYKGYYSSYYNYCPPVTYNTYNDYYASTYRKSSYYYPSRANSVTTYTNTVYTPAARAPTYVVADDYSDQTYSDGWSYLSSGRDRSAFRYFSRQASRHIDDGQSKLGYAISSAFLGKHDRAIWAMRRALNVDPYSLSAIRFDTKLLSRIDQLAEHYAQHADKYTDPDADFMLAALSFLLEDHSLTSIAIDSAIAHGDTSEAAYNLKAMIAEMAPADTDYP